MRLITAVCATMTAVLIVGAVVAGGPDEVATQIACSLWATFFIVFYAWMRWWWIPNLCEPSR